MQVAKVVFVDSTVRERRIGDFTMRQQTGYLKISEHVSHEFAARVPDDGAYKDGYPPGVYLIGAETFRTDDYGRLGISKKGVALVPEPKAVAK